LDGQKVICYCILTMYLNIEWQVCIAFLILF
jgi:hypothetical protein